MFRKLNSSHSKNPSERKLIGMLEEIAPIGAKLSSVWWESREGRIRLPRACLDKKFREPSIHGTPGVTFGRQIGAYPLLVGVPFYTIRDRV